jgi:hypothetical protein
MTTFTTAAARTAVVAAALAALTGGALATAASATAAPIQLTSVSTAFVPATAKNARPSLQDVVDANNAARAARDKANAAATATGTARGTLDDKRAQLAIAQRDAQAAQNSVDAQRPVVDAANRAFVAAGDAKKQAAQATNADPNDAVKEAEYNIRNQMWLDRLRELADVSRELKGREQARDGKNAALAAAQGEVTQAETALATAQAEQTRLEKAAEQAECDYDRVKKDYERRH